MKKLAYPVILFAVVSLFFMNMAMAANSTKPEASKKFKLLVRVIEASKIDTKKPKIDKGLLDIANRLSKIVDFNRYRIVSTVNTKISAPNGTAVIDLPGKKRLTISIKDYDLKQQLFTVRLNIKELLSTDYKVSAGKVLIVGGIKPTKQKQESNSKQRKENKEDESVIVLAIKIY